MMKFNEYLQSDANDSIEQVIEHEAPTNSWAETHR